MHAFLIFTLVFTEIIAVMATCNNETYYSVSTLEVKPENFDKVRTNGQSALFLDADLHALSARSSSSSPKYQKPLKSWSRVLKSTNGTRWRVKISSCILSSKWNAPDDNYQLIIDACANRKLLGPDLPMRTPTARIRIRPTSRDYTRSTSSTLRSSLFSIRLTLLSGSWVALRGFHMHPSSVIPCRRIFASELVGWGGGGLWG